MASEPDSEDWKRYPTCLPSNISGDSDLEAHRKRLYEHSAQIFMGHGDVEVWTSNRFNQGEKIKVILQDCDEVHGQTEPVTGKFQVVFLLPAHQCHLPISSLWLATYVYLI